MLVCEGVLRIIDLRSIARDDSVASGEQGMCDEGSTIHDYSQSSIVLTVLQICSGGSDTVLIAANGISALCL